MISLSSVHFKYQKDWQIENLSANFEEGLVHGIIGLNGSGKTTLFNLLAGHLKADKGTILFHGQTLPKRSVGFLETELYFYPKLSAREFLNVFPSANADFNQEEFCHIFHLPPDELISNYSTGMKKKLMLLSQIKQNKQIYILDEPYNGLDFEACKTLQVIIELLKEKKKTVFISSHILASLTDVCDKIYLLRNGGLEKHFTKSEFHTLDGELFGQFHEQLRNKLKEML